MLFNNYREIISYLAFLYTHGWSNAYFAENLLLISIFIIFPIKSNASLEIVDQSSLSKINLPFFTFSKISFSFFPVNGG